ncbi:hypothetical protein FDB79_07730 [Clostridium botulinum]|nr:hypothetical protein [Clostridium botulinum]
MCNCKERQTHVHEFLGSTRLAEIQTEPHNHRFAGVSGQAIRSGNSHVHFVSGVTSFNDGHRHEFIFATLIEAPIFEEC